LHRYLYVGADPVNYVDPSGLTETVEHHFNVLRLPCIVAKIDGVFSILDWTGYPAGLPKPEGPFKILEGEEYARARELANKVNKGIHRRLPWLKGLDIHEQFRPQALQRKRLSMPSNIGGGGFTR
jgi:hypothetical protein